MSVKITDKPTATSMSTADKIFANIGGALKQITKEMFLKDTHDKIDQVNSNLSNLKYGELAGGKNLFTLKGKEIHTDNVEYKVINENSVSITGNDNCPSNQWVQIVVKNIKVKKNTDYVLSIGNVSNALSDAMCAVVRTDTSVTVGSKYNVQSNASIKFHVSDYDNVFIILRHSQNDSSGASNHTIIWSDLQLEEGTTATDYEPYIPSVKMLSEENAQQSIEMMDLKMLGWSVPRECPVQNEVNGNQFVQKVGRADMSKLNWTTYSSTGIFRFASESEVEYTKYNIKQGSFAYLRDYNYVGNSKSWSDIKKYGNKTIMGVFVGGYDNGFILTNSSYTNLDSFKQAMQGQYLYYELATPITKTIDGNEKTEQIDDSISDLGKCKNLLKPTLQTTTQNGVTCTNNGDGTYTLKGTKTTDTIWLQLGTVSLKANKSYKLIGQSPTDKSTNVCFYDNNGEYFGMGTYGGATPIITPKTDITLQMQIRITEKTLNNFVVKPMITTNLNATYDDFVPYTWDGDTLTADVAKINSDLSALIARVTALEGK